MAFALASCYARGLKPTVLTALVSSFRATGFSLWASVSLLGLEKLKFWLPEAGLCKPVTAFSQLFRKVLLSSHLGHS